MVTSNPIANWWRSFQLRNALQKGDNSLAEKLLQDIQKSGVRLSWQEKLLKEKLQFEKSSRDYRQQISAQYRQLSQFREKLEELEIDRDGSKPAATLLTPEPLLITYISQKFKLVEHDETLLQCTGIDDRVFDDFEQELANFIQEEFNKLSRHQKFEFLLDDAIDDLNRLKSGQDPLYRFELSPHIYLMRYFLDNVYCAYLAWFLIYKSGLLPAKINILDIAAGPATIAYGLALLLQSNNHILPMLPMHVSYYSLEQQKNFQYRGLQFWRRYLESQETATNAYFRFDTSSIFDRDPQSKRIPTNFFDFIAIAHCFFYEEETRIKSQRIYQEIFTNCLKDNGYVLLIIQDKKLFRFSGFRQGEDLDMELTVVKNFLEELGLHLVWYKYLTSRGKRQPISDFGKFARENLAGKKFMSPLLRQYFQLNYNSNYTLDDYVILAKR